MDLEFSRSKLIYAVEHRIRLKSNIYRWKLHKTRGEVAELVIYLGLLYLSLILIVAIHRYVAL